MNPLHIRISTGAGTGPTSLSAFDAALVKSGIANFNLLRLSSVIPTNSQVHIEKDPAPYPGGWGDKLYVVYAEQHAVVAGDQAWAGVGWVQDPQSGFGLFVEHEGPTRLGVESDIEQSLIQLQKSRGISLSETQMVMQGTVCEDLPVCALVVAVFEAESWNRIPVL